MGILDGKVAIVTGASQGIGWFEAIALAKEGAAVTVTDLKPLDKIVQAIEDLGGRVLPVQCDVSVREQVDQVVTATVDKFGGVDILVNNAMYMGWPQKPVEEWAEEDMRKCYDVGALGSWFFMTACFPHMKEKGGKIINTCSGVGYAPHLKFYTLGYLMAKEAIRALTRTAANEWGSYGINVNVIAPATLTPAVREAHPTKEAQDQLAVGLGIVLGRWGDTELEVARPVVFLAGPDSDFITGCTLSVDGGLAMVV